MRPAPGGFDAAPYPIPPRDQAILARAPIPDPATQSSVEDVLGQLLRSEGITLDAVTLEATAATVRVQDNVYHVEAQAIGRVAHYGECLACLYHNVHDHFAAFGVAEFGCDTAAV
ncbi:hypothetical protein [Yoonia sp.]|uniref:hypothetical protein n=1 Tax=Yoonia sp. TaxID=2212373 RepID=UPI003F4A9B97